MLIQVIDQCVDSAGAVTVHRLFLDRRFIAVKLLLRGKEHFPHSFRRRPDNRLEQPLLVAESRVDRSRRRLRLRRDHAQGRLRKSHLQKLFFCTRENALIDSLYLLCHRIPPLRQLPSFAGSYSTGNFLQAKSAYS